MSTPNDPLEKIAESAPENPDSGTSRLRRVLDYIERAHPNLYRAAVASYKGTRDGLRDPLTPVYEGIYGPWDDTSLLSIGKKTMFVATANFLIARQIASKIKENYRLS